MLIQKLKEKYNSNDPIFIEEIYTIMEGYSKSQVFILIKNAIKEKKLGRFDRGIYHLLEMTIVGYSVLSIDDVVYKKYVNNNNERFGIFGIRFMEVNFCLSTQIPSVFEVITNNTASNYREIKMRGFRIHLRKSRVNITNKNYYAYTILELFTQISINEYLNNRRCQKEVKKYIYENKITKIQIYELLNYFPKKTKNNLITCKVIDEFLK